MGHNLHAIIGRREFVSDFAEGWVPSELILLHQEFALVPMTVGLFKNIDELANLEAADPFDGFERLSAGVEFVLRHFSGKGAIGYIETDYFGGVGTQSAIAWSRSQVLNGPFLTTTSWDGTRIVTTPQGEGAINRVLSDLGVRAVAGRDRFDSLELGKFRARS